MRRIKIFRLSAPIELSTASSDATSRSFLDLELRYTLLAVIALICLKLLPIRFIFQRYRTALSIVTVCKSYPEASTSSVRGMYIKGHDRRSVAVQYRLAMRINP